MEMTLTRATDLMHYTRQLADQTIVVPVIAAPFAELVDDETIRLAKRSAEKQTRDLIDLYAAHASLYGVVMSGRIACGMAERLAQSWAAKLLQDRLDGVMNIDASPHPGCISIMGQAARDMIETVMNDIVEDRRELDAETMALSAEFNVVVDDDTLSTLRKHGIL